MANPNEIRVYLLGFSESQNPAGTKRLLTLLRSAGIRTEASDWILKGHTINPLPFVSRAHEFSKALVWKADWILDVTGGDGANAVLDLLDYEGYQNSDSILAGYSDVSCVLNALAWKTGRPALLFQASGNENEKKLLALLEKKSDRLACPVDENRNSVYGDDPAVYGGNVRSFLKLAGTPYLPDLQDKPLFLEAYSTSWILFVSYLAQLEQMRVFSECSRLIIGQLSAVDEMLKENRLDHKGTLQNLLIHEGVRLPEQTSRTRQVGHSRDALALWIGKRPACFAGNRKGE